jgi:Na+/H+ antiporter NhaD/arsenite permease-like protein
MNRKLMNADQMMQRYTPRSVQYGSLQQILFVMGIMLAMGVVTETGVFGDVAEWIDATVHNVWVLGVVSGMLSGIVDSFTIAMSDISLYPIADTAYVGSYEENFVTNGAYWKIIAFCTAVGGCLLSVGSVSGLALMKMEHMRLSWYLKNLTLKVLAGMLVGLAVLWLELNYV